MCRYFQHVGRVGKDVQARASAGRRGRRGVEYSSGGERADISPRRSRNTFTSTPRLLFSSYKACVKKSTCCLIFLHHMIPHTGNIENVQHIKKKKLRRRWSNQKKAAQPADVFSRLQRLDALGRWFMQKKGLRGPPAIKYRSALSAWAQIKSTCTK